MSTLFGPDVTFLGVPRADLSAIDADVVVIGAPFDGGTSHRPGTRFGPSAIRQACYLPQDGSRPSLALRVDALRGYWPGPATLEWMAAQGMRSYEMSEVVARGLDECLDEAFTTALDDCDGVFLSVDVDVVDPGMAPGTGTPEPGGLTTRQLLDAVRRTCLELPVVGIDVVEVSPPYDHAEVTAFLGNRGVLEALSGMAWRRRELAGQPVRQPDSPLLEGR